MVSGKPRAFCLLVITSAVFIQHTSAACDETTDVIKFEHGKSYVYEFSSVSTVHQDAYTNGSKLLVSGNAILTKSEPCEYILSLENLGIVNQDSKPAVIPESLVKTAVRFTRKNGIVDGLFVSEKEDIWVINIKRAIVSMLQNKAFSSDSASAASTMELSVSGHCPTMHFKAENKYIKQIDLNECAQRETAPYSDLGIPYDVSPGSRRNSYHLLNSSSYCDQDVADDVIKAVTCSEEHQAFNYKATSFWFTLVKSSLVLKSTEATKYTAEQISQMKQDTSKQSTIVFDQTEKKMYANGASAAKNVEEHVKNILLRLESDIDQAELYLELVDGFKELETPMEIYSSKDFVMTKKGKTLFLNAAFETDTAESLRFISQLIQTDINTFHTLHHRILNQFFKTITFSSNPKIEGVDALESLINAVILVPAETRRARHLNDLILLGSSAYANRLCTLFSDECSSSYAANLKKLSDTIAKYVQLDPSIRYMGRNIFVSALHALGNLHHLSLDAVSSISKILKATQPDWMKIVALQAYRSDPCQKDLKDEAKILLNDESSSDDLKINSYLALSKCVTSDDTAAIEKALNTPEVLRFISSHVRNIQDSVSPSKNQLKNSLSLINLPTEVGATENNANEFSVAKSRYIEYSYYDSKNNIGFSAAATFIYNKDSMIPASATFELSVDALGRTYNILEASLSPRILRQRYIADNNLDMFKERYGFFSLIPYTFDASDSYFRHFGVTTNVREIHSLHTIFKSEPDYDMVSDCMLRMLRNVNITDSTLEWAKAIPRKFFDVEFLFPTISGLPLSLDIQAGSLSSIDLNITGTADFENLMDDFQDASADFKSLVRKSTAISFKQVMRVGKPHVTPIHVGIAKEKNLDAASEYGISLFKQNITTTHLKIDLPQKEIVTFSYSKKTYFFEHINGAMNKVPYSTPMDIPVIPVCYKGLRELSSLETCVVVGFPHNGVDRDARQFNLTLRKYDDSLQFYEFKWDAVYGPDTLLTLSFDTPGTKINRKAVVQITPKGDCDTKDIAVKVESPWRNFDVTYLHVQPQEWCPSYNITADSTIIDKIQVKFSESEVYEWNFKVNGVGYKLMSETGEIIQTDLLPFGLDRSGYDVSAEFSHPTPSGTPKKYSVLGSVSQKNEMSTNTSFKGVLAFGGDWAPADMIGEVEVEYGTELTEVFERFTQLRFSMQSKILDKVNYEASYRAASYLDYNITSSLLVNGKTFEHTITKNSTEEYSQQLESDSFTGRYVWDGTYKELPQGSWSKFHATYDVETSQERDKRDAYLIFSYDDPNSPITWNGTFLNDNSTMESKLTTDVQGENYANIEKRIDKSVPGQYTSTLNGFVKDHVEFQGKSKLNTGETKFMAETDFQATCLKSKKLVKYAEKLEYDSGLVTKHCQTTWGHDGKPDGSIVSDTTLSIPQRTLEAKAIITLGNEVITKTVNATLAQDILNGHSGIVATYKDPTGWSRTFLTELDTTNDQDKKEATSLLHFLIDDSENSKEGKNLIPLNCTLNKAYNWNNAQPEIMSYTRSVASNLVCITNCPENCEQLWNVNSLFVTTMTSARDLYTMSGMVNTSGSAAFKEMDMKGSIELIGPEQNIEHNGMFRMNGSAQDTTDRYAISVATQYEQPQHHYEWHDYTTYTLTKTLLSTEEITVLAKGHQNTTGVFKSITNFDISDNGEIMIPGTDMTWARVIRMNDDKFLVLYQLMDGQKIKTLIEFEVKMKTENDQTKIDVLSKNSFEHKPSNFNFTLTR